MTAEDTFQYMRTRAYSKLRPIFNHEVMISCATTLIMLIIATEVLRVEASDPL